MTSGECGLSVEHATVLTHALAGWIKTVRGDAPRFGSTTDGSEEDGTVYREFWKPFPKEIPLIEDLVRKGLLFWGANKITAGITTKGLGVLREMLDPDTCPPGWISLVSQLKESFSGEDIEIALNGIRRA